MNITTEVVKKHEDEIKKILEKSQTGLSETDVKQIGMCLDNIKDCYKIKRLRQEIEDHA